MAKVAVKGSFWNVWHRLPIPDEHQALTDTWFHRPDEKKPTFFLLKKTLQRLLFIWLKGQRRYWLDAIPVTTKKVLWLHSTHNLGDSLMRLAPIQLLAKHCQVDLYTSPAAINIFSSAGSYFNQVYRLDTDAAAVQQQKYDLVILDSIKTDQLKRKIALGKDIPFVTMHDMLEYCRDDYNSLYYSWWRMQYLLREFGSDTSEPTRVIDMPAAAIAKVSSLNIPPNSIAVAVGGREPYRIYHAWDKVLQLIAQRKPQQHFVLLGSANGSEMADVITKALPASAVTNLVAQCSLAESAVIIQQSPVLLCADGGLMHVASAVGTKTISLFAEEYPELRYVASDDYQTLQAKKDVNEIDPTTIAELVV